MSDNTTEVGYGQKMTVPKDISYEEIWEQFIDKIFNTSTYLPVTDIKTRKNENAIYREMTMTENSEVISENIYVDKEKGEVRFVRLDDEKKGETDEEVVNRLNRNAGNDPIEMEYFLRRRSDGERIWWKVSLEEVMYSMNQKIWISRQKKMMR